MGGLLYKREGWSTLELQEVADDAIRHSLGIRISQRSVGSQLELERLTTLASPSRYLGSYSCDQLSPPWPPVLWLRRRRLLSHDGIPTPLSHVYLQLSGLDLAWFALELERAQWAVRDEPATLAKETLEKLLNADDGVTAENAPPGYEDDVTPLPGGLPFLKEVGLIDLRRTEDEEFSHFINTIQWHFTLPSETRPLIEAVLSTTSNPFRERIQHVLEQERDQFRPQAPSSNVEGVDPQAIKLVIHELRNRVLPLENTLQRLWQELERPSGGRGDQLQTFRARLEGQLKRMADLPEVLEKLVSEPETELFRLQEVVADAIGSSEAERNGRIKVYTEELGDIELSGSRQRWTLLFINLFRNSSQARAGSGAIWVSSSVQEQDHIQILVDDDGPGIPPELHSRIFLKGISSTGGTGMGLYDARRTVEQSGGRLDYDASPRGGARFRMDVPGRSST
ncbi:MAG: sensor histidine kinase [Myxococcota bacterium]